MSPLEQRVRGVIGRIYDPCSVTANAPLSLFDMGLITGLEVGEDGKVAVSLRPTSPSCTMIPCLKMAIMEKVRDTEGVTDVRVDVDGQSRWTHDAISPEGRQLLEAARNRSQAQVKVRPQQWRERVTVEEYEARTRVGGQSASSS